MEPNQKKLNLIYTKPIVAYDLVTINGKRGGEVDLLFSQVVKEESDSLDANVVAGIRFASVDALEAAQKLIAETVEQIKKQEK